MPDRVVSKSFPFLKIRKGESNLAVDLDNEMTSIVVAENGGTKSTVALHPLVRAFYGTQSVIGDCTVTASSSDANVTATYNTTTHCVDISIQQDVQLSDVTTITITVAHSTYGTRVVYFIIAAVREGIDAFIQELLPSLNEISFARQSDNSLSPSSRSLTLSFKKTKGETVTIQSISESGLTVRWSASSMPSTSSDGNSWGSGTGVSGITWSSNTMQIANSVSVSNIYIACFNSSGTLVDRETIPVIKDGDKGNDGKNAGEVILTPTTIFFNGDEGGYVYDTEYIQVGVGMKVDGQSCVISDISVGDTPEYVSYTLSGTTITFHNTGADYGYIEGSVSIVVTGTITSGGITTTYIATGVLSIVCTHAGEQGNDAQYIYLKGSAFNKDSGGTSVAASEIKVNGGSNLATQSRGLCLVTLNRQTLAVVDGATIYDTYEGTTGKNNLITKLNSLGDNVFVCLVSYDSIGWSDTLISLLQTFGMSDLPYTSANRYPFLFIGYKNLGKGNGITRMNDMAEPAIPVELGVYVANGALSVKDGKDGDDAPVAFANPDKITIPCGISGYVSSALTQGVTFSLKVGTNAATVTGVTSGTKPTGVTVTGQADNAVTITIATTATASGLAAGVTFTVTGTYGGKTYSATITVALIGSIKGDTGSRGKIGRFYYYAQEWVDSSNVSYSVTDTEAPFFAYNNNYWVFNPTANGSYSMHDMGAPSSLSENWKLMVTDFKYLITEAIFGAYAHFGSFIINGDWLISQHGTINGQASTNYTQFDPDHPYDNTGTNFIPNFAVDGLTGKTYQNDAYIRGEVHATSGELSGSLVAANGDNGYWRISKNTYEGQDGGTAWAVPSIQYFRNGWAQMTIGANVFDDGSPFIRWNNQFLGYASISGNGWKVGQKDESVYMSCLTTNNRATLKSNKWARLTDLNSSDIGCVYVDDNGYLKVKT